MTAGTTIASLVLLGLISAPKLPLAFLPEVSFPSLEIEIPYPNALPAQVEEEITRPAEEALATLSKVQRINSWSSSTGANINVQFDWGQDIAPLRIEAREKLERIRDQLPVDVDRITVNSFRSTDIPVLECRVAADRDLSRDYELLERHVADALRRVPGVAKVELYGVEPPQVHIDFHLADLQRHRLQANQILDRLDASSRSLSAGMLRSERRSVAAARRQPVRRSRGFKRFPVGADGLRLEDIATVTLAEPDLEYGRHLDRGRAIGLNVMKESGANTVAVAERARRVLHELEADPQLKGIRVITFTDQGERSGTRSRGCSRPGSSARSSPRWCCCSSCGASPRPWWWPERSPLAAGRGRHPLLRGPLPQHPVDDGAHARHRHAGGQRGGGAGEHPTPSRARRVAHSRRAARQPRGAAGGDLGDRDLDHRIPAARAGRTHRDHHLDRRGGSHHHHHPDRLAVPLAHRDPAGDGAAARRGVGRPSRLLVRLAELHQRVLAWTLVHRPAAAGIAAALFVGAIFLFMPVDKSTFTAAKVQAVQLRYEFADNVNYREAERYVDRVEDWIQPRKDSLHVKSTYSYFANNEAMTRAYLASGWADDEGARKVRAMLRQGLPGLPGLKLHLEDNEGASESAQLAVRLYGEPGPRLDQLAEEVQRRLARVEGLTDVVLGGERGRHEVEVVVDRQRATSYGLTTAAVGGSVAQFFRGRSLARFRGPQGEVEVQARLADQDRQSLDRLEEMPLAVPGSTATVPSRRWPISAWCARLRPSSGSSGIRSCRCAATTTARRPARCAGGCARSWTG